MKKLILCLMLIFLSSPAWAELAIIPLQHRSAEDVLPIIRPLLDKDGVASGMNNRLILRTSPRNLAEIKRLLPDIDTAPRRLRITVMQNVDSETVKRFTGLSGSVGLGRNARLSVPDGKGNSGSTAEAGQGADRMRARVLSTSSLEDDMNTQQVQVIEGGQALISVGQSVPVHQHPQGVRRWGSGSSAATLPQRQVVQSPWGTQMTESTQYRDVNSGFYVRPQLSGDRVTLEISAQNDAFSPGSGSPSSTRTQQLNTTVSGYLGEWIELGDASRQKTDDGTTLSTRSVSDMHERRSVLIKVEEIQ